jgi:predicted DNA-binding WGR domain protein
MRTVIYQVEHWRRQDWSKGTRHYSAELRQNLFGQWVVLRRWGRVTAVKGQSLEHLCRSYEEGLEILSTVEKRRARRGYAVR